MIDSLNDRATDRSLQKSHFSHIIVLMHYFLFNSQNTLDIMRLIMHTESYMLYDHIFNWDKEKNLTNIEKHGVPFKEAATVFLDPNATLLDYEEQSLEEERFNIVGISCNLRLLTVCHCYRDDDTVIRIISARKATKLEIKLYGGDV